MQRRLFEILRDYTAVGEPAPLDFLQSQFELGLKIDYVNNLICGIEEKLNLGVIVRFRATDDTETVNSRQRRNPRKITGYLWNPLDKFSPPAPPVSDFPEWKGSHSDIERTPRPKITAERVFPDKSPMTDVVSSTRRQSYLESRRPVVWRKVQEDVVIRVLSLINQHQSAKTPNINAVISQIDPLEMVSNVLSSPIEYEILSIEYDPESAKRFIRQIYEDGLKLIDDTLADGQRLSPRLKLAHQMAQSIRSKKPTSPNGQYRITALPIKF